MKEQTRCLQLETYLWLYFGILGYNKADFCSAWANTDFALMKLKSPVSQNSVLTWLGWDKSNSIPSSGTGIHHPKGDVMKISYELNPFGATSSVMGNYGWEVDYDLGITEKGSSGSPILNQDKRVVGQLHGGPHYDNACLQTNRHYGKFNLSWTGGGSNNTRLSNWLDPIGTGLSTFNSFHPNSISISGFSHICINSTVTYTISNIPSGYTVNWAVNNSNFTITSSGNQCIVAYTGSEDYDMATLTANVYYNSNLIKQFTKSIKTGFPELDALEFYNYYGEGNWIEGNAGNVVTVAGGGSPYYDQYECDIYRLNNNGTETLVKHMCRPTPNFEFGYPWEGWFVVYIRGINDCGYSEWSFGEIECEAPENNGPDNPEDNGCRIVYSPDGNCLFISWTDEAMQRSAVMQKDGKASTYEVQIWNETKKVKSVSSNQQETRVPLAGLPKGFYIAKVIRDGKNCATKFSLW
jgi:hypothetical protein